MKLKKIIKTIEHNFYITEKKIEKFFEKYSPLKVKNYYEDFINLLKICESI